MKKFMLACAVLSAQMAFSQKIVKEHYTVSGGLLGAANFAKLRVSDNHNLDYNTKFGWGAGAWLNIPLGKVVSFEPQFMYNSLKFETDAGAAFLKDTKVSYFSVPVLLKFHLGDKFALTAGPQFDFVSSVDDNNNRYTKDSLEKSGIALNVGAELFPHGRVTPFARYIHGLKNIDKRGNANPGGEYFNQNIQVGLKLKLFGKLIPADSDGDGVIDKNDECPNVAGLERYKGCPIPDTDKDGINDEEDKCPTEAGLPKYGGCPIPDTDKDGVNDEEDKCIDVPGIAKYNGCPIPDSDKDGVNDEEDKCPNEAGLARYQGCPPPDRDNDGVNDDEDRCPDLAGTAENAGCPALEASKFNASAVQFVSGSATLTATGRKELDKAARILNEQYPQLKVQIAGHTDNTGKAESNQVLSEKRAAAVKAYLVKKGIADDRLTTIGYGQDQPVADNGTAAGRTQNRRVEFKVSQ
ncbi:OmpA family protein [Flavihumibacter sp. ZG627]|uniref:OmpA family protein n=1 Tax=Flavihumibacter sp. ZG627 TaxID=1463156 RepID=UPI00069384E8|nr:OmpA family protein [Flavihumibacter sp. ZG627]